MPEMWETWPEMEPARAGLGLRSLQEGSLVGMTATMPLPEGMADPRVTDKLELASAGASTSNRTEKSCKGRFNELGIGNGVGHQFGG